MYLRSSIGSVDEEGGVLAINLLFSISQDHVEATLRKDYRYQEKVDDLLELGDLAILDKYLGQGHDIYESASQSCVALIRDEHLSGFESQYFSTVEKWLSETYLSEFAYFFESGKWRCFRRVHTSRSSEVGKEVLGYWIDEDGLRITKILDFSAMATAERTRGRQAKTPN